MTRARRNHLLVDFARPPPCSFLAILTRRGQLPERNPEYCHWLICAASVHTQARRSLQYTVLQLDEGLEHEDGEAYQPPRGAPTADDVHDNTNTHAVLSWNLSISSAVVSRPI